MKVVSREARGAYMSRNRNSRTTTGSKSAPPDSRPLNKEELASAVRRLERRLSRHLDAFDGGHLDAIDDIAAVLRTLLAHGDGDRVLLRFCREFKVELPMFYVSPPPIDDPSVLIAAGGMPMPTDLQQSGRQPGRWVDFRTWIDSDALIVKGALRRRNTWNEVISRYANTYGAHVSTSVPALLAQTEIFQTSGYTLGAYMIRAAALLAETALQQVHAMVDGATVTPANEQRRLGGSMLTYLDIRKDGDNVSTGLGYFSERTGQKAAHLLTVPLENGRKLHLSVEAGGRLKSELRDESGPVSAIVRHERSYTD